MKLKKTLLTVILILALAMGISTAAWCADSLPQEEDTIAGFCVTGRGYIDYLDTDVIYMEHEQSGAQLIYFANDDLERSFSVGFRTNAENDKGIPHVFEHSTLAGSAKYPDPNLLFNAMNQTYSTYINAATYPSMTIYPCASLSEEQLFKLMDMYMAGVADPVIMEDERAMKREAYRYILENPEDDISITGAVYSEMKGVMGQAVQMAQFELNKLLYPGSVRSNSHGGFPDDVLTMTWQELKDFHNKYYHPSNMLLTLYGDIDLDRFLSFLDQEYLSHYDRQEIIIDDPDYQPYEGYREESYDIPASEDSASENVSYITYGIAMDGADEKDAVLAQIVASSFGMDGSILQKKLQEELPGAMIIVSVNEDTPVPTMVFQAMNVNPEDKDVIMNLIEEAITDAAVNGIDPSVVQIIANSLKLQQLQTSEYPNIGVNLASKFTLYWGRTGRTDAVMENFKVVSSIGDYEKNGDINQIAVKYLVNPKRSALAITHPVPGLLEKQEAENKQMLTDMKEDMTEEEIARMVEDTADFDAWTEENSKNSMIDEIKVVDAQSLPEEAAVASVSDTTENGVRRVVSEVDENGMVMVRLMFDASSIPYDMLQEYKLYTELLGNLSTQQYMREDLKIQQSMLTGGITFSADVVYDKDGVYHPYFIVSWSALAEYLEEDYRLVEEILLHTDFSDVDYIRNLIIQNSFYTKMLISSMSPNDLAVSIGQAAADKNCLYENYISNLGYIEFLNQTAEMSDKDFMIMMGHMEEIRDILMNKNGLIISCVGNEKVMETNDRMAAEMINLLDTAEREPVDYLQYLEPVPKSVAVVVDGEVQYNALVTALGDGREDSGKDLVMKALVTDKILLPNLRFKNGAYGAITGIGNNIAYEVSYRDPNYEKTYEQYEKNGDDIRNLKLTEDELNGFITAAYSNLALPKGTFLLASEAIDQIIVGDTEENATLHRMQEVKQFTREDVQELSQIYDKLWQDGVRVTVGSQSVINEHKDDFDVVYTTLIS